VHSPRESIVLLMKSGHITHCKKAPRLWRSWELAIPSRGIFAERSSPSRVRFARAFAAPLTAAGRSAHLSARKECGVLRNGSPVRCLRAECARDCPGIKDVNTVFTSCGAGTMAV